MELDLFLNKLMEAAKKAGIEAAEAYVAEGDSFKAVSASQEIIQYAVNTTRGLSLRGLYGGRMGYASTEVMDEEAVDQLVEGVLESAMVVEDEDRQVIYAGDTGYPRVDTFDPALDQVTPDEKIGFALHMEKAALEADSRVRQVQHNTVLTGSGGVRIRNTYGLDIAYRGNYCAAYLAPVVREGERVSTAFDVALSHDFALLDARKLAAEAVDRALFGLSGKPVKSGSYRVIIENGAMADLLETFSGVFSAENAQHGLSLLKGRVGETVAAETVMLMDDPLLPYGNGSRPFDDEGVACKTKAVIEKGVLKTLLHNLKTAAKDGVQTTANASRASYSAPVRVAPTNLFIKPGEETLQELMAKMGDGLVITELSGLHSGANSVSGDFSLLSKGYTVKEGKKCEAVEQVTIAGNFFELLKEIRSVGADLKFPGGNVGSPSVFAGEMSVAGA